MRKQLLAVGLAAGAALTFAAPAAAGTVRSGYSPPERYETMAVPHRPGPEAYDRVRILKVGDPNAHQVLVLEAGGFGAAGSFRLLARDVAARMPQTQVWAVDRREEALNDESGFKAGPDAAAAYYLGGHAQLQNKADDQFVAEWGLATQISDLHAVVAAAREHGRRVVLGGHSWGATIALAYAAWDFDGRPGYRDLSGVMMIDGGMHDAWAGEGIVYRVTPADATAWLQTIAAGQVFDDGPARESGHPETLPVLLQLAGAYAQAAPHDPSALAPYLPDSLAPTAPVTNAGLLGWLLDAHALVPDLSVDSGQLTASGDWQDTGHSPIARVATLTGGIPPILEWYWPNRLTLDLEAADPYADTATTRELGLRLWHAREIDMPLYSFDTGLVHGSANTAARWVVANSRIRTAVYGEDETMRHIDPLSAAPERNRMLDTLLPFLAMTAKR